MFSRAESSKIRHEFWTVFGKYMSPVPSSTGMKINWVNYHTGIKDVYFRMDAGAKAATIAISIEHSDPFVQELYFHQFLELKTLLHATLDETWTWKLHDQVDEKVITRIYKSLSDASVYNRDDWPDLISFFKQRIIQLDQFWEDGRYLFEGLN